MSEWINVNDRLPNSVNPVIAFGINRYGRNRILRAAYAHKYELEPSEDCSDDWGDYNEELDQYFAPEGWYEWNDQEETHWMVDFDITHWMPLPEPPHA